MLGIFHPLMYMGILSKRFEDAGLFDVLVQSLVIAETQVYNRDVRCMKHL